MLISSDVLVERIEAYGPKRLVFGQPLIGDLEWFGPEPVEPLPTLFALVHEAGVLQRPQVLRHAGKLHRERRCECRRRNLGTIAQTHQNPASGRITESAEDCVERCFLMRNHMV